jgi:uncharacterized membrane-anchored protein
MSKQTSNITKRSSGNIVKAIYIVIVIVLALLAGFFFYKYQDVNQKYTEATMSIEERNRRIVEKVSKLYDIPSFDTEQPAVYLVDDPEQLKDNQFFANAQKGDFVLTYQDADLAILYREPENRIIKSGSYRENFAGKVDVAIIANASAQKALEDTLKAKFSNINIISKSDPNTNITEGVVVDVEGTEEQASKDLATLLNFKVGKLPEGEKAPEGAKLIIIAPSAAQ